MAYQLEHRELPNRDVFVPKSDEESYLKEHGIEIIDFENGTTIVASSKPIEDERSAQLKFDYPIGSYYDPANKQGILHFLEHVAASRYVYRASRFEAQANASTSTRSLDFELTGTLNQEVMDYGIWPVLPLFLNPLLYPIRWQQEDIDREKEIVLAEIRERYARPTYHIGQFYNDVVFGPTHPAKADTLGTDYSVGGISTGDLDELQDVALTPQGLYVTVSHRGDRASYDHLLDQVKENIKASTRPSIQPKIVDQEKYKDLNENLLPGRIFSKHVPQLAGLIEVDYVWLTPTKNFEPSTFAGSQYWNSVAGRFLDFTRKHRLGYHNNTHRTSDRSIAINRMTVRTPKIPDIEARVKKIADLLRDQVLYFDDQGIEYITSLISRRLRANPVSFSQRLGDAVSGLKYWGRIIDSDKGLESFRSITPEMLKYWRDIFTSTEPAIVIAGDIS